MAYKSGWKGRSKGGNPDLRTAEDWRQLAVKSHLCTACLAHQPTTWKVCPKCGAPEGNREFMPSMAELKRAAQLCHLARLGKITDLKFHPLFDLKVDGVKVCVYEADSQYMENGKLVVEDTKPSGDFMEPVAKLKIALFNALHSKFGISVKIYRGN